MPSPRPWTNTDLPPGSRHQPGLHAADAPALVDDVLDGCALAAGAAI